MLLDIHNPVRSAILIYLLAVIFLILYKPEFATKRQSAFFAPTAIFIAILSYFILIALSICV